MRLSIEWKNRTSTTRTAEKINNAFEEQAVSRATVGRWFNRFVEGKLDLEDEPHPGRALKMEDDVIIAAIQEYPKYSTRQLGEKLGLGHSAVANRLHALGYKKVLARWIPHRLSDNNKSARLLICQSLLLTLRMKEFLEDIVTGDESYICYDNVSRQAVWIPRGQEPPKQPKPDLHPKKLLLCCFWDSNGMLFWELLPVGHTVTATVYCGQLQRLADAIAKKRSRRRSVRLLHDNARPHTAKETQQKLKALEWETVPHPPYSPDLAPSDFHLFRPLKQFVKQKTFVNYESLKKAIVTFF